MKFEIKYILFILFTLSFGVVQASTMLFVQLPNTRTVSAPAIARPDAQMTSTSTFLAPRAVQISSYNGGTTATIRMADGQMASYTPLTATSLSRRQTRSANFGVAGMAGTVQSSAIAISRSNFENNAANAAFSNPTLPTRRNGRDEPDDPADPPGMETPVGDVPIALCLLLIAAYVFCKLSRKKKLNLAKSK